MLSRKRYAYIKKLRKNLKDAIFILLGILSAGFGLQSFIIPNHFLDGGAMGLSLITKSITQLPLPILILVINMPFVYMAWNQVSMIFAIKTLIAFGGLALVLAIITFPVITTDKLLISAFGGVFLGMGIGLAMRGGAVLDGTEVLALYISRKYYFKIGDVILVINIIIFSLGAFFINIETAMYAIVTYMAASKMVDFVVQGLEEYVGVTIVSEHNSALRHAITHELGKGVTLYHGQGGYGKRGETDEDMIIIYTVTTRIELGKLMTLVDTIDPRAFVTQVQITDISGGIVKQRRSSLH